MLRFHRSRFGWILVLALGLWALVAQAQEYRYHYVSLDQVELPAGFAFFPGAIHDSGRVYGTVCDVSGFDCRIAVYAKGSVTVLQTGEGGAVNAGGTVGGFVWVDPENFIYQAALFPKNKEAEFIPAQPGEVVSLVIALNDPGTALVWSFDELGGLNYVLYNHGQTTRIDFGPNVTASVSDINNHGLLAGTQGDPFDGARAFRFDPSTGEVALLSPVPPDTLAWGMDINNSGNVLGYSFVNASPYHERIGVWDHQGHFETYFDETIVSNDLVFNDNNLIVITFTPALRNSYLVPKPGVRLNLADLVENLPLGQDLFYIYDINNHGDMIGYGSQGNFLLERCGATCSTSASPSPPSVENRRHAIPPAVVARLLRHMLPLNALKSGFALPQDLFRSLLLRRP